jgi:hypothetical protein
MILIDKREFLKLRTPGNLLAIIYIGALNSFSGIHIKSRLLQCRSTMTYRV